MDKLLKLEKYQLLHNSIYWCGMIGIFILGFFTADTYVTEVMGPTEEIASSLADIFNGMVYDSTFLLIIISAILALILGQEFSKRTINLEVSAGHSRKQIFTSKIISYLIAFNLMALAVHADLKDDGQTIYFPEIKTTAKDNVSGNHYAKPEKEITLIDTVSYQNLIPGKEYTLTGTLMDKETEKPLEVDGKPITAQTTFTPEKADGNVELSFTFDASALRGKTIVVFESVSYKEKEIAVHADIDDHEQSIYFPEIKTTAKDGADDDKEVLSSKEATVIDTVTYKNLIPKAKYKLVGILMDKETGKAILVNEKTVTAETEFSPKESDGSVDVTFTFDASELNGHDVVVFEKLFLLDGDVETEITSHEDIKDEGQTVKLTETPKEPPKTTPPVKTGDDTTLLPFIILAGTALLTAIGFGVLYFKKRKK